MEAANTLQQAILHFADFANCRRFMVELRWGGEANVTCPRCGSARVTWMEAARKWKCYEKHQQPTFTLKTGTIFEDSPIGLEKWLPCAWMVMSCKNGISSYEVSRALGVTQKTAWFMLHRVRLAMQDDLTGGNLAGEIEVDETFIGGKARNMHRNRKVEVQKMGRNTGGKTVVLGLLERAKEGSKKKRVIATVVPDRKKDSIQPVVQGNVEKGSKLMTDEHGDNWRMTDYDTQMVNHLETYVKGNVHTNGMENFWSLLKRGLGGTYIAVEPFHLFRYVDEQAFRYNTRLHEDGSKITDGERFKTGMKQIVGKRLTYAALTGKTEEAARS